MNDNALIADIEGYAAIFGERDLNGDIIARGAFAKTLVKRTAPVRMLFSHIAEKPIGRWKSFIEDARGLFVKGEILLSSPTAREVHALLAGGAIDGLSIGYQTLRARKPRRGASRRIVEAELWEVSVVTFPMAQGARVTHVGAPRTESTIENLDRVASLARPSRRTPGSPTGVRQFAEAQFADILHGAASILSV